MFFEYTNGLCTKVFFDQDKKNYLLYYYDASGKAIKRVTYTERYVGGTDSGSNDGQMIPDVPIRQNTYVYDTEGRLIETIDSLLEPNEVGFRKVFEYDPTSSLLSY